MVVGHGMVGARFVEELRRRDRDGARVRLTVLGAERRPAYNRVLLSTVLAGGLSAQAVELHEPGWARRRRVDLRLGVAATAIDRTARVVHAADGSAEPYDELVLATGSRAWVPPLPGLADLAGPESSAPGLGAAGLGVPHREDRGVRGLGVSGDDERRAATFRTLDDCEQILRLARPGARVAVLGGGLLGCEAARGLAGRGVRVTLLHPKPHLMERQLDVEAGAVLAATLHAMGVEVWLNGTATAWEPGSGVRLDDGTLVPAGVLVVAAGVRAETGLAAQAGIAVDRGILVDDRLTTSDPRVHAIGDCAQHTGTPGGLVQPGFEQATVLADLLSGADPAARYRGTPTVTRLKARGIDLAAVGDGPVEIARGAGALGTGTAGGGAPGTRAAGGGASATGAAGGGAVGTSTAGSGAVGTSTAGTGAVGSGSPVTEVVRFVDPTGGRYAALALLGDRVVGGTMIGLPDAAASMVQFFDSGAPAPADRLALLFGRALPAGAAATSDPGHLPGTAVVCRCNTVTKDALVAAWRAGFTDVPALATATRAGTGCGSCRGTVAGICEWLGRADPLSAGPAGEPELREGAA